MWDVNQRTASNGKPKMVDGFHRFDKKHTETSPYLTHSPLAMCDFFLFPQMKSHLKGIHFEGVTSAQNSRPRFLKAYL